eukprot:499832_1
MAEYNAQNFPPISPLAVKEATQLNENESEDENIINDNNKNKNHKAMHPITTITINNQTSPIQIGDSYGDFSNFIDNPQHYNAFEQQIDAEFEVKEYSDNPNDESGVFSLLQSKKINLHDGIDITNIIKEAHQHIQKELEKSQSKNVSDKASREKNSAVRWLNNIKIVKVMAYHDDTDTNKGEYHEMYIQYLCQQCGYINKIHEYVLITQSTISLFCAICNGNGTVNNPIYTSIQLQEWQRRAAINNEPRKRFINANDPQRHNELPERFNAPPALHLQMDLNSNSPPNAMNNNNNTNINNTDDNNNNNPVHNEHDINVNNNDINRIQIPITDDIKHDNNANNDVQQQQIPPDQIIPQNGIGIMDRTNPQKSQQNQSISISLPTELDKLKCGRLYNQYGRFTGKQMHDILVTYPHAKRTEFPWFLFGDTDLDHYRDITKFPVRIYNGGTARILGIHDRTLGYGILVAFKGNDSMEVPEYKQIIKHINKQFKQLQLHLIQGYDVVVPIPTKNDVKRFWQKYSHNDKQIINHDICHGMKTSQKLRVYIQSKLNELQKYAKNVNAIAVHTYKASPIIPQKFLKRGRDATIHKKAANINKNEMEATRYYLNKSGKTMDRIIRVLTDNINQAFNHLPVDQGKLEIYDKLVQHSIVIDNTQRNTKKKNYFQLIWEMYDWKRPEIQKCKDNELHNRLNFNNTTFYGSDIHPDNINKHTTNRKNKAAGLISDKEEMDISEANTYNSQVNINEEKHTDADREDNKDDHKDDNKNANDDNQNVAPQAASTHLSKMNETLKDYNPLDPNVTAMKMYWHAIFEDIPEAKELISFADGDYMVYGTEHKRWCQFKIYAPYGDENIVYCKIIELVYKYNSAIEKVWANINYNLDNYQMVIAQLPEIAKYINQFDKVRCNKINYMRKISYENYKFVKMTSEFQKLRLGTYPYPTICLRGVGPYIELTLAVKFDIIYIWKWCTSINLDPKYILASHSGYYNKNKEVTSYAPSRTVHIISMRPIDHEDIERYNRIAAQNELTKGKTFAISDKRCFFMKGKMYKRKLEKEHRALYYVLFCSVSLFCSVFCSVFFFFLLSSDVCIRCCLEK